MIHDPNTEIGLSGSSSFVDDAGGLRGSVMGLVGEGPTYQRIPHIDAERRHLDPDLHPRDGPCHF